MIKYRLYSSEGCHLCELAYEICKPILGASMLIVDIIEDDTSENNNIKNKSLVEQYGIHIPVLERIDNHEKVFWPFDAVIVQKLAQTEIK